MLKRAVGAVTAVLALATLTVPGALLASQSPAAAATARQAATASQAATDQPNDSPVSIAITSMTPTWVGPKSKINVTGSLTNVSKQQTGNLTVQLFASTTPISSIGELAQNTAQLDLLAGTVLPGASWQSAGQLAPGASATWSITVKASAIGMTTFGVYPLAAQAQDSVGTPLTRTTTYLPYIPAKKGPYSHSRPVPQKIAWTWPLIDTPLLNEPWQKDCQGPAAQALARSLTAGGRLADLLSAGAKADRGGAGLTWAVDPALLANVRALTTCRTSAPSLARPATEWLAALKAATAGQPLFVTPYADVNVTALIRLHHEADVSRAFLDGGPLADHVLDRNVSPAPAQPSSSVAADPATGFAWPADGIDGLSTVENLAVFGVRTVVLSDSAMPSAPSTVVRTENNQGGYVTVLLASQPITDLLGSATSARGSVFATSQQFLAETAVLAAQNGSAPIIVAPPRRWQPPVGLADSVLFDSSRAPWLSPVSMPSLTTAKSIPVVQAPTTGIQASYSRTELRQVTALDRGIRQILSIRARPSDDAYLALATIESSAFRSKSQATTQALLNRVAHRIAAQLSGVHIIAESRVTLGGLKGSVPVSIDNSLGFAVQVTIQPQFSQASGVRIHVDPAGLVTVSAHSDKTVHLRIQAAQVGSTTVTMRLVNAYGQELPDRPGSMTIQATQVGVLGMIIFAAALGVFLIASAARAVRRGRPAPLADQAGDDAAPGQSNQEGGEAAAEPDTVMAERSEIGTAGPPGL